MPRGPSAPRSPILLRIVRERLSPRDLDCLAATRHETAPEHYDGVLASLRRRLREDLLEPAAH